MDFRGRFILYKHAYLHTALQCWELPPGYACLAYTAFAGGLAPFMHVSHGRLRHFRQGHALCRGGVTGVFRKARAGPALADPKGLALQHLSYFHGRFQQARHAAEARFTHLPSENGWQGRPFSIHSRVLPLGSR